MHVIKHCKLVCRVHLSLKFIFPQKFKIFFGQTTNLFTLFFNFKKKSAKSKKLIFLLKDKLISSDPAVYVENQKILILMYHFLIKVISF